MSERFIPSDLEKVVFEEDQMRMLCMRFCVNFVLGLESVKSLVQRFVFDEELLERGDWLLGEMMVGSDGGHCPG